MAIRDSANTGNTNNATFAFGSAVNAGDQLRVTNTAHAITIDGNLTIGASRCTAYQTRPVLAANAAAGSLPAGAYRCRIAAVGSTGSSTASCSSLQVTITAGQSVRITLPTLPAGATSWSVYLTNTGGAANTERLYATGKAAGTFDCSSASWMDGTDTYTNATALPFGDAFGYSTPTAHAGGVIIADGVTLTCKGDLAILGDLTLGDNSILEFDATDSPSGAAIYRLWCGTVNAAGTAKIIMRGASGNRAEIRSKSGTTQANIGTATQTSTNGNVRLDLQWGKFSRLGGASVPAIDCFNNAAYNQLLTDVVFDTNCRELNIRGVPATGGWILNRVTFNQTAGNTYSSLECCAAFQQANAAADVTSGTRTVTDCCFNVLMPALSAGGATYTGCYFHNLWANLPSGAGGSSTSDYTITNSFVRKLHQTASGGVDNVALAGNTSSNYLYIDYLTGGGTDLNPHGLGCPARGTGTTRTHSAWSIEYNGNDDSGDMFKSPGTAAGTLRILNALILPNAASKSTGTVFTFPHNPNAGYRLEVEHCTYVAGPYGLSTSEGGAQPAGTITSVKSNLAFSIDGTTGDRFLIGKADGNGSNDTLDVVLAANATKNAGWNLQSNGNAGTWYNIRCTGTPGTGDVDLGDSPGADIAANGPEFVAPSRKFVTWAATVLGATGTDAQKIATGLAALKAIADTSDVGHVSGLTAADPATWVRAGWVVSNPVLDGAGHDGTAIGACGFAAPPIPASPSGLTATRSVSDPEGSIDLVWSDNSDNEDGFDIEWSADGSTNWTALHSMAADATSHTNSGLAAGLTRYYRVKATNAIEGDSGYSNVGSASTAAGLQRWQIGSLMLETAG